MSKQIAIIGNGKLGKKIVRGLIDYAGYPKENIFVITSNYFEPISPDSRNLELKENLRGLKDYEHVILAVGPSDAVNLLIDLRGKLHSGAIIISFVTGLEIEIISHMLTRPEDSIIRVTSNINIAYGCGIICYRAINSAQVFLMQKLFVQLADSQGLIDTSEENVDGYTVLYGSVVAFDDQDIELRYEEIQDSGISFNVFLRQMQLNRSRTERYLDVKKQAIEEVFGYQFRKSAILSFESNYQALCSSVNTIEQLNEHKKAVVTPGGCTEKGLALCNSIEDILSVEKMTEAFNAMYDKVLEMKNNIRQDFETWQNYRF